MCRAPGSLTPLFAVVAVAKIGRGVCGQIKGGSRCINRRWPRNLDGHQHRPVARFEDLVGHNTFLGGEKFLLLLYV